MVDILRIEELGYAYLTYKKELINYGYEVRKISMKDKTIDIIKVYKRDMRPHISFCANLNDILLFASKCYNSINFSVCCKCQYFL